MANNTAKAGGIVAGAGCLFGLAPLIVSFIAAAFGSSIGNVLHWYTLFTAPVGAVVVVVGLVMAIAAASRSTPEDFVSTPKSPATTGVATTPTPDANDTTPVVLPRVPTAIARSVKIAYAIGFGVLAVSCVMRVTLFQSFAGILTLFDLVPAFFAGWFFYLARRADDGLYFLRLHRSQLIVSIAGCVVGIYPLLLLADNISMLNDPGIDKFQWGGTIITDLIPFAASIASLAFAETARTRYRASIAKN